MKRAFGWRATRATIGIWLALSAAFCGAAYAAIEVSSAAAASSAPGQLYWGNNSAGTIDEANLDGSGAGSELGTTGTIVDQPTGIAIDPATNKIYWTSAGDNRISVANLDGSGAQDLYTAASPGGASVDEPVGIAIDPATNKIYWANTASANYAISEANLDGTGDGRDLYTETSTGGGTLNGPQGLAIDPAANKIYWTNAYGNTIDEANLDGTGDGSDLSTTGATTPDTPVGLAIDPATNKVYWSNANDSKISETNLDGTGNGSDVSTTGASVPNGASGVAIDPAANKIYWTDKFVSKISEANLDGTGNGTDLYTAASPGGATVDAPDFPALLEAPSGTGVPLVTASGSTLSCSQGTWESDPQGEQLYLAPRAFTYSWTLNGAPLSDATQSTLTASSPGTYGCTVTASNFAGSTTQTSTTTFTVPKPAVPSCTLRAESSHVLTNATKHRKATLGKLRLATRCTQTVQGKLTGTIKAVIKAKHGKRGHKSFALSAVSSALAAGHSVTLTVTLPKAAFSALSAGASESATFSLTATNANGSAHPSAKITHLKLKKPRRK